MKDAGQRGKQKTCEETRAGLTTVTISRLKARLEELEQQSTILVAERHDLSAQVAALQQSCNEGMAQLSQAKLSHKQQENALQDEVLQLKNKLADARAAGEESSYQVEAARSEVHALLAAREGVSQKLRAQVAQLQSQLTAKTAEAATLSRKLAAVEPLADALEAELRSLHQSLAKVTSRVNAQEAALKHHEKRLLETTRAGEKLADLLEVKEAALQAAQQQVQDMKDSSTAAEQAHHAAQRTLQEQLLAAQQQIMAISADHATCQAELNGKLVGLEDKVQELQVQVQEGVLHRQAAALECTELKTKLAAAETAAAAAVVFANEQCNAAVLAVIVLQKAHLELHTSASVIIQAAKHAAADARTAAATAVAEGTVATAAAEALQLAAEEATAAAEAAEAKASAAEAAAEAAKATAAAAEHRAATAEAGSAAATAKLAAAEAAAAAATTKATSAEQELATASVQATALAVQQQQPAAHVSGTATVGPLSLVAPADNMASTSAAVVKRETSVSPSPPTAAAAAAAVSSTQPGVLSGSGQPGMLSGNKRTVPESACTAEPQQLHAARQCRPALIQPAVANTLAAHDHHHHHHQQQQHGASGCGLQNNLQQQQRSSCGAAVSAMNILNPYVTLHNTALSYPFPCGSSGSFHGSSWSTQQACTHPTAGASNPGVVPATFMPARQALPQPQHISYSQEQQHNASCLQQQPHASQEACKRHQPHQQQQLSQQQLRPYLSQQQQHCAVQEPIQQQQRRQFAWLQVTQLQHPPLLAAANIMGARRSPGAAAAAAAKPVAPVSDTTAAEQQRVMQTDTALPGTAVNNSKSVAEVETSAAISTGAGSTATELNCNRAMAAAAAAAASTAHKQSEGQHSTDRLSNNSRATTTVTAAPAALVALGDVTTTGTGRDVIGTAAADCPKACQAISNRTACTTMVKSRQAKNIEGKGAFYSPAAAVSVKEETEPVAVISMEPAQQPAGDQKAGGGQQQSVAAVVAEGPQRQRGVKKAAKPATAMGVLFCALADSDDESE